MATRDRIRAWLGLDDLATKTLIAAAEKAQRERHAELIALLGDLITGQIETKNLITVNHAQRPPMKNVPVYDWEQVQLQELAEMLANPPKDEN